MMALCTLPTCNVKDKVPFLMVVSASRAVRDQIRSRSEVSRLLGTNEQERSCPAYKGQALSSSSGYLCQTAGKEFGSLIMAIKYPDGLPPPYYPSVPMVDPPNALPLEVSSPFSKKLYWCPSIVAGDSFLSLGSFHFQVSFWLMVY